MASESPEVLLLTEHEGTVSDLLQFFDRHGCHCTVGTLSAANELVQRHPFDFVVSMTPLRQEDPFVLLLGGTDTKIFYRLTVEDGCWWVPLDGKCRKSLGRPALRSVDFTDFLEKALDQLTQREQPVDGEEPADRKTGEQKKQDRESVAVAVGGDL